MNKKKLKFIEEYSDNFSELFVEMFVIRYGPIDNYDNFLDDYKYCLEMSKQKINEKMRTKLVKLLAKRNKESKK